MVRGWVAGFVLLTSTLLAPVPSARAQAARPSIAAPAPPPALLAERARLQGALTRVNAEVDALKASPRGLRDDYRLRNRMADAEELARRLTELDTRLGVSARTAPHTDTAAWPDPPRVEPSDNRAELEAKADILTDQARRLAGEADRLESRVTDLRARRQLRRRAGQLEDDPFSPLEQAKGRVGVSSSSGKTLSDGSKASGPTGRGPTLSISDSAGAAAPPTAATPEVAGSGTTTITNSPSAQLRGALDPSSLAEIRRLDSAGSSPATLAALERAIVALRQKAAALEANAHQIRERGTPLHP